MRALATLVVFTTTCLSLLISPALSSPPPVSPVRAHIRVAGHPNELNPSSLESLPSSAEVVASTLPIPPSDLWTLPTGQVVNLSSSLFSTKRLLSASLSSLTSIFYGRSSESNNGKLSTENSLSSSSVPDRHLARAAESAPGATYSDLMKAAGQMPVTDIFVPVRHLEAVKELFPEGEVVTEDLTSFYVDRLQGSSQLSSSSEAAGMTVRKEDERPSFSPAIERGDVMDGSMGGYPTYDELKAKFDAIFTSHPDKVTRVNSLTPRTLGNRAIPVYWFGKTQTDTVPRSFVNSHTHAREGVSGLTLLHAAMVFTEFYGRDYEANLMMDYYRIAMMPIVNPDGMVINEQEAPSGGGVQRKNGRPASSSCAFTEEEHEGVDLNRNFNDHWSTVSGGSSSNECDDTYHGDFVASEPETVAFTGFSLSYNFTVCVNYHSYGGFVIHPYGWSRQSQKPGGIKGERLAEWSAEMSRVPDYFSGPAQQTLGYVAGGAQDDWLESVTDCHSFTPEAGNSADGFWPEPERAYKVVQENMWPIVYGTANTGVAYRLSDLTVNWNTEDVITVEWSIRSTGLEDGVGTLDVTFYAQTAVAGLNNGPDIIDVATEVGPLDSDAESEVFSVKVETSAFAGKPAFTIVVVDSATNFPWTFSYQVSDDGLSRVSEGTCYHGELKDNQDCTCFGTWKGHRCGTCVSGTTIEDCAALWISPDKEHPRDTTRRVVTIIVVSSIGGTVLLAGLGYGAAVMYKRRKDDGAAGAANGKSGVYSPPAGTGDKLETSSIAAGSTSGGTLLSRNKSGDLGSRGRSSSGGSTSRKSRSRSTNSRGSRSGGKRKSSGGKSSGSGGGRKRSKSKGSRGSRGTRM